MSKFLSLFLFIYSLNAASVTEVTAYYPPFCLRAAKDEQIFQAFRSETALQAMIENVTYDQGASLLAVIEQNYPHLLIKMAEICEEDKFGKPVAYQYQNLGPICPATLRYVKIFGDLQKEFGDLTSQRILEIGGGYGGQCKIINQLLGFKSYTIIDLPQCIALIYKYLDAFHVPRVRYINHRNLDQLRKYDLLISNYAFSEIGKEEQREYLEKVIVNIPRGYITYNYVSSYYGVDSLSVDEVVSILSRKNRVIKVESENPVTGANNVVIIWHPLEVQNE